MRTLLIGSGNKKKLAELRALLADLSVSLLTPRDLPTRLVEPVEDGDSFEANATKKALGYAEQTGLWTLADDSGLMVDALAGRPGVHSARFAGEDADDAANNRKLLLELSEVPPPDRTARFVCSIVLAAPGRPLLHCRGECEGRILDAPVGVGGFGYDPLFFNDVLNMTFAEASADQKARVSHRGKALAQLKVALNGLLLDPSP